MQTKHLFAAAVTAALALLPSAGQAQTTFTDNAGNYTGYVSGSGANTPGFGAFVVSTTAGPNAGAGTFVASASESENNRGDNGAPTPGSIDTFRSSDGANVSFGTYASGTSAAPGDPSVTVMRSFTNSLQNNGDSFSLDFVTGYNDGKNLDGTAGGGTSGVELLSGTTGVGSFFYQSDNQYLFNGTQVQDAQGAKQQFATGALHLTYTITSPTTYSFTSTGAVSDTGTGTFSAPITGFEVQQTNATNAGDAAHNAYFNNLSVTSGVAAAPEPSGASALVIAAIFLGGTLVVRRRRMGQE